MDEQSTTWIDPKDGIEYRLTYALDGSRVATFTVETKAPEGIQFTALRRMRPADHVEGIRREKLTHKFLMPDGAQVSDSTGSAWGVHGSDLYVSIRVPDGMRRATVERAAHAARHYRDALRVGSRTPRKHTIDRLREDLDNEFLHPKTVDNWISAARTLGLLPGATQGKPL